METKLPMCTSPEVIDVIFNTVATANAKYEMF